MTGPELQLHIMLFLKPCTCAGPNRFKYGLSYHYYTALLGTLTVLGN